MKTVMVNGVGLGCEVSGRGRPLLLLHGFSGTAATWAQQVSELEVNHRAIAVDLLGHGRAEAPLDPDRYRLDRQADDLATLLSGLEMPRADVVGYSMGARIALRLALDHPARVERLVLESPSAGIIAERERANRRRSDDQLADRLEADGVPAFVEAWEAQPLFASHAELPDDVRAEVRRERLSHTPSGLANALRGAGQGAMEPLQGRLAEVHSPSLVVAGELDPIGRDRAAEVAGGIVGARLETVARAGHTPHLERPREFARLISTFLTIEPERTN